MGIKDAHDCVNTTSVTITAPTAISGTAAATSDFSGFNIKCNGGSDGIIEVTATGGTGTLQYSINGGAYKLSNVFTGLIAGPYDITVKDANGCIFPIPTVTVTEPPILAISSISETKIVTCFGGNDGEATVVAAGGTGAGTYTYQWYYDATFSSPVAGATASTLVGVPAATYYVMVTDANLCTKSGSVIVTQPTHITGSGAVTTVVSCNGVSDAVITVTASGGSGTLEYDLNGAGAWQVSNIFSGLGAGTYTLRVRDALANICVVNLADVVITQPAILAITGSVTSNHTGSQISCPASTDGTITVAGTGGTTAYQYNINGGAYQLSPVFGSLGAGIYTMGIKDAHDCVNTTSVTITAPTAISGTAAATSDFSGFNIKCNGGSDGIIEVTATGGTGTLQYSINGGAYKLSNVFTGLIAGPYDVTVKDVNGCIFPIPTVTVTEPPILAISSISETKIVTCFGGNDGEATVVAAGGTGAGTYTYQWYYDATFSSPVAGATASTLVGVPAATYYVMVTDANLCTKSGSVIVTQPTHITGSGAVTTVVSCNGVSDAVITVTASGGSGTLEYDLNGANAWQAGTTFSGLGAGTYTLRVRDALANICVVNLADVVITQPAILAITGSVTSNHNGSQISCPASTDGTITVAGTGGTTVYQYNINGGAYQLSPVFGSLGAGIYTMGIKDAHDCVNTTSVTITAPTAISGTATVTSNYYGSQLSCNTATDGKITVIGSGGTGAFSYILVEDPGNISGATSGVFTGLPAGPYNFTVTDQNSCSIPVGPITITAPPALTITVNVTSNYNGQDISCFGASDGKAEAVVTGGTGSYSYNWFSNPAMTIPIGQMTAIATNLVAGTYYVKVKDANDCEISGNVTLNQPVALNASITTLTNVACYGNSTGSVTVVATPATGTSPYTYSINGGSSWEASGTYNGLSASSYTVLVKDVNGCIKSVPMSVTQPTQLTASITSTTNVSCNAGNNGAVTVTATPGSGTAPYTYSIDGGITWPVSGTFTALTAGSYSVIVKDFNSCTITIPVTITEPAVLVLNPTPDVLLNCFGNTNGTGTFYALGGTAPYTFSIEANTAGAIPSAPGFNSQTILNAGAGVVTVKVTDSKGCEAQSTITFTQPADLTPGVIGSNQVVCYGADPVAFTTTAPTGGPTDPVYNYQWQDASSSGGTYNDIPGATLSSYTPPAAATVTLYYRRMVASGLCNPVYSNEVEILVNPLPLAILSGGGTICPTESSVLNVNLPVGTGPFEMDIDNLGTITGYISGADITVSPLVTTTYKLTRVRDFNGCEVSVPANLLGSATVTVRALPVITMSPDDNTVCEFAVATFTTIATGSDLTYQWFVNTGSGFNPVVDGGVYFGANNPTLSIFGATRAMSGFIYHVEVSGCLTVQTSGDAILTVNTAPEFTLQPADAAVCLGSDITMSADATGTSLTWNWDVNKGAGFVPVTADVNFSGETTNILTITAAPPAFNNWIFRARATGICGVPVYSSFARLTVINAPIVSSHPTDKPICENGSTTFIANGTGYISLQWQVFSGGSWNDISDDATYSGTTTNQLAITNAPVSLNGKQYRLGLVGACAIIPTNGATLTVNPNPVVNFPAPINACGNVPIVLDGNPTGGTAPYPQNRWTGEVGPLNNYLIQSPTFNSGIDATYNLNYAVVDSKGCTANADLQVIVDSPSAIYTKTPNDGCTPLTVSFTKDMAGIASFSWDFGDGSPAETAEANPSHTFTNTNPSTIGYYNVTLTVNSPGGCTETYTSIVTVYPAIDPSFTTDKNTVCSNSPIVFTSLPGASKYFWDFGDGVSGYFTNTINHVYTNNTTAPVSQTITLTTTSFYNCTAVKTMNITVMPVPIAQFTASPVSQYFKDAGNPVTFTNTTNPGTWTWLWRFGDGSTSNTQNPTHTYTSLGTFDVVLNVSNETCSDSIERQVSVTPLPPVAAFDQILSGCTPLTIDLNNTSANTNTPGTTYLWDFGDGGGSTSKNPSYTYFTAGIFRVELTVTGPGGTSSVSQIVSSYASPKANFDLSPALVFVNDEKVKFFNLTQGADSYLWDFGDGDTSKVKEPFHKYMTEGVYDVTLWAYLNNMVNGVNVVCSDKYVMSPGVTVEPAGTLRFSTVFTPNKDGEITIDHLPTGTQMDQFFFPAINEKVIKYKLQIFNRLGVLIFESNDINTPWNGYYHGTLCAQGVYVWYVEGKYANGMPFKKVGDVTLLH